MDELKKRLNEILKVFTLQLFEIVGNQRSKFTPTQGMAMLENKEMKDVAPTSLNHLVGQDGVKNQVSVALDAAFADCKKFDSTLLVGPPGLGKTQMANVIAVEMASGFHDVLGQSIASPADLNSVLLAAKDKDVIHVDEAHELDKTFQTSLYLALDQRKLFLQGGKSGNPLQSIPIADFTLLLSTTDEYCLLQPLRDRMKLVLRFDYYSESELAEILARRCRSLGWRVADELPTGIAQRSRGTPRLALRLLESCRRVCRAEGEVFIREDHLVRACQLEQIDDLGLGTAELRYLQIVGRGTGRLNVIASMLGLPSRTIAQVVEPFLIRAGLILKDDGGKRQLTAHGRIQMNRSEENEP